MLFKSLRGVGESCICNPHPLASLKAPFTLFQTNPYRKQLIDVVSTGKVRYLLVFMRAQIRHKHSENGHIENEYIFGEDGHKESRVGRILFQHFYSLGSFYLGNNLSIILTVRDVNVSQRCRESSFYPMKIAQVRFYL